LTRWYPFVAALALLGALPAAAKSDKSKEVPSGRLVGLPQGAVSDATPRETIAQAPR
jgi:hypothetical protein